MNIPSLKMIDRQKIDTPKSILKRSNSGISLVKNKSSFDIEQQILVRKTSNATILSNSSYSQRLNPQSNIKKKASLMFQNDIINLMSQRNTERAKQRLDNQWDHDFNTCYDHEMDQIKKQFNPKVVKLNQKASLAQFLHWKKLQSKEKKKFAENDRPVTIPAGTFSFILNQNKKDFGFDLSKVNSKIPQKSKFKMKWKAIQWLINNKRESIEQLQKNVAKILKLGGAKGELDRNEFGNMLKQVSLGGDKALGDKLFYIFDEDGGGTVDYKELIMGLEIFKNNSIEEKLQTFFNLCDLDNNGEITPQELYKVLKQNVFSEGERMNLKNIIDKIFNRIQSKNNGSLQIEELFEAAKNNIMLKQLIIDSVNNVQLVDNIIENDLKKPSSNWIPETGNFHNLKEGIHFNENNYLLKTIDTREKAYQKIEELKKNFKDVYEKKKQITQP